MGREGGEGEQRGKGRRGKGRGGKGRTPHDPLAWGPQCFNAALVGRTPVFGRLSDPVLRSLTGDHYVGKPSAGDKPTRPTQRFILSGSINE